MIFPQQGKWFSAAENVLRTSKHNLPFADANLFSIIDLWIIDIDFWIDILFVFLFLMTKLNSRNRTSTMLTNAKYGHLKTIASSCLENSIMYGFYLFICQYEYTIIETKQRSGKWLLEL